MLRETLRSLDSAIGAARANGSLAEADVTVIDNGPGADWASRLEEIAKDVNGRLVSGHGNVGYGRGHNIALLASSAEFHLVLNPDVIVDEHAIDEALRFLTQHPEVVILAPLVRGQDGRVQHLCKR